MRRKEDAAVQMLSAALEGFISERKSNLEIYEVKLVLVEMLIYQVSTTSDYSWQSFVNRGKSFVQKVFLSNFFLLFLEI